MKPVDPKYKKMLNDLAASIDQFLNGDKRPKKLGFALLLFEFNKVESGRMNWISNGHRDDMLVVLKEMVAQLEGRTHPGAKNQ